MVDLAQRAASVTPEMGAGRYSREELEQLIRGFEALLLEELFQRGRETRELFMETAIPGLVGDGQRVASLTHASTTFSLLVAVEVLDEIGPEHRPGATVWLADFFGGYVSEVAAVATVAVEAG